VTLAGRIAGGLILLALVAMLVPGGFFYLQVQSRLEDLENLEAAELQAALARRHGELQAALERSAARLAADLAADGMFLSQALVASNPRRPEIDRQVRERAASLLALADLDLVWIVHPEGRVLSCGHWPAQAGTHRPELLHLAPGSPPAVPLRRLLRDRRGQGGGLGGRAHETAPRILGGPQTASSHAVAAIVMKGRYVHRQAGRAPPTPW
jgi:hypothetical protein